MRTNIANRNVIDVPEYCPNCGVEITETAKYCSGCGIKVEKQNAAINERPEEHATPNRQPLNETSRKKGTSRTNKMLLLVGIGLCAAGLVLYADSLDLAWAPGTVDVTGISAIVTAAGVLVAVVYYILEIRHQSRLRQTESVIRLSPWFNMNAREVQEEITQVCSIEYKSYEDYIERYSGKPEGMALKLLGNYFEGVGILVYRKLVNADIVYDFWGDIIQSSWEKIRPLVADMRKDAGDSNMFQFWEYLYQEMRKREKLQPKA